VKTKHLAARHPCATLSTRIDTITYLAVLRVFGWLALLARPGSAKDAEIRAHEHNWSVGAQVIRERPRGVGYCKWRGCSR
jgi:hypothetical protein